MTRRVVGIKTIVRSNSRVVKLPGRARWKPRYSLMSRIKARCGWTPRNLVTLVPLDSENEDPAAAMEQRAAFTDFLRSTEQGAK